MCFITVLCLVSVTVLHCESICHLTHTQREREIERERRSLRSDHCERSSLLFEPSPFWSSMHRTHSNHWQVYSVTEVLRSKELLDTLVRVLLSLLRIARTISVCCPFPHLMSDDISWLKLSLNTVLIRSVYRVSPWRSLRWWIGVRPL